MCTHTEIQLLENAPELQSLYTHNAVYRRVIEHHTANSSGRVDEHAAISIEPPPVASVGITDAWAMCVFGARVRPIESSTSEHASRRWCDLQLWRLPIPLTCECTADDDGNSH